MISAAVHTVFIGLRIILWRSKRSSIITYILLCAPSLFFEFWLERIARPSYVAGTKDLRRSGENLNAKGLTEYMWDVIYWTWLSIVVAAVVGDWGWWLWVSYFICYFLI